VLAWLPSQLPASIPVLTTLDIDGPVAAAALGLIGASSMLLSAWPILRLVSASPTPRGIAPRGRASFYRAMVIGQIAAAVVLVSAAALLGRSLNAVYDQHAGFAIDPLLVANIQIEQTPATTADAVVHAFSEITESVALIPGVQSVAGAYDHPLAANWTDSVALSGDIAGQAATPRQAELRIVSPSYFDVAGTHLVDGRAMSADDGLTRPGVAIVNESFARTVEGRVIGRHLESSAAAYAWGSGGIRDFEIVGIVEDERFRGLEEPSRPAFYLSTSQFPQTALALIIRADGDPSAIARAVRAGVRAASPRTTVDRVVPLGKILAEQLATRRTTTEVVSMFGLGALALAALGLYGLMAMSVGERRREFGVRMALGATPASLAADVIGRAARWTGVGVVAGLGLTLMSGRLIAGLLFNVTASDPATLVVVVVVLFIVAFAAACVPAARASRVDPATSLRGD
jgi:predicted permease